MKLLRKEKEVMVSPSGGMKSPDEMASIRFEAARVDRLIDCYQSEPSVDVSGFTIEAGRIAVMEGILGYVVCVTTRVSTDFNEKAIDYAVSVEDAAARVDGLKRWVIRRYFAALKAAAKQSTGEAPFLGTVKYNLPEIDRREKFLLGD